MFKKAFRLPRSDPKPSDEGEGELSLVGEHVVLRNKRLEDVADDYAWRTDEELARLDATRPTNLSYEEYAGYAREDLDYTSRWSRRFAIETRDGKHIGNCMYYDIDVKRGQAELGIMIGDRDYWNRGYGTDSVDILLDHIFTSTPFQRVYLHTLDWNQRARRSFARSGFVECKTVRRGGQDFVLMEVLRSDWERRRNSDRSGNETGPEPPAD